MRYSAYVCDPCGTAAACPVVCCRAQWCASSEHWDAPEDELALLPLLQPLGSGDLVVPCGVEAVAVHKVCLLSRWLARLTARGAATSRPLALSPRSLSVRGCFLFYHQPRVAPSSVPARCRPCAFLRVPASAWSHAALPDGGGLGCFCPGPRGLSAG